MGVTQLWNILEPVKCQGSLSTLRGKKLCVDLSCWICEAHGAKGLKTNVLKPHLRNLFFRVWHLTRCGVNLVFVVDGDPPELKWEAIIKRTNARRGQYGGRGRGAAGGAPRKKVGRSNFRVWVNECTRLLTLLGIPFVESAGEAEALCAWLDAQGYVDGCITNDGDAFLYGARVVYKDLCISAKECSMECFSIDDIQSKLVFTCHKRGNLKIFDKVGLTGLGREELVALAVLLGCDYLPQGVPGVGKEMSVKLVKELDGTSIMQRFLEWKSPNFKSESLSNIEKNIRRKALQVSGFPNQEVINEFLSPKLCKKTISLPHSYKCPDAQGLQEFCLKYLEWPEDYTSEKVLPLVTYWQMMSEENSVVVFPERILKERVQQKVECYEVLWNNCELGETCRPCFATIETRELLQDVYPEVVEEFVALQLEKQSKKSGKQRKKVPAPPSASEQDTDYLCAGLDSLILDEALPDLQDDGKIVGTTAENRTVSTTLPHKVDTASNKQSYQANKALVFSCKEFEKASSASDNDELVVTPVVGSLNDEFPHTDIESKASQRYHKNDEKSKSEERCKKLANSPKDDNLEYTRKTHRKPEHTYGANDIKVLSERFLLEYQTVVEVDTKPLPVEVIDLSDSGSESNNAVPTPCQSLHKPVIPNTINTLDGKNNKKAVAPEGSTRKAKRRELHVGVEKENNNPNVEKVEKQRQNKGRPNTAASTLKKSKARVDGTDVSCKIKSNAMRIPSCNQPRTYSGKSKLMKKVNFSSSESSDEDSWMDGQLDFARKSTKTPASKQERVTGQTVIHDVASAISKICLDADEEKEEDLGTFISSISKSSLYDLKEGVPHNDKREATSKGTDGGTENGWMDRKDRKQGRSSSTDQEVCRLSSGSMSVPLPATPLSMDAKHCGSDVDSPVFLPLSLSERLGKNLKGRENALNSLRSISRSSENS